MLRSNQILLVNGSFNQIYVILLIYLFTYLVTYLLSYLLTDWLTDWLTYLLTYSLTYLLSFTVSRHFQIVRLLQICFFCFRSRFLLIYWSLPYLKVEWVFSWFGIKYESFQNCSNNLPEFVFVDYHIDLLCSLFLLHKTYLSVA